MGCTWAHGYLTLFAIHLDPPTQIHPLEAITEHRCYLIHINNQDLTLNEQFPQGTVSGGFPSFKMTLGIFLVTGASSSVELGLVKGLLPVDPGSSLPSLPSNFEPCETFVDILSLTDTDDEGLTREFEGEEPGVVLVLFEALVRSRKVRELGGMGTMARGADDIDCEAEASNGVNIANVRSSHGSTDPWAGSEARPPRRFFVADSS